MWIFFCELIPTVPNPVPIGPPTPLSRSTATLQSRLKAECARVVLSPDAHRLVNVGAAQEGATMHASRY